LLDDSINKITSDFENRSRREMESIGLETNLLVENLKKDMDRNIQSYIEQMRHKIKNELVNDAIQEAINNICKESLPYKEDYEERVIKGLYEIRFANDKKLHVK
jgi:vacuolar-type H+-ATPase catalytic subunit A/Vma1